APRKRRMKPIRCFFVLSIEGNAPFGGKNKKPSETYLSMREQKAKGNAPSMEKAKNKRKRSENLSNPLTKKRGRAILTHEIANALQFRPTKCENMVFLRDMDLTKSKAGAILY
ncbi:MAG: hypothetical protein MSA49_03445, partial [Clostridia bacterium]|nr:hypothetical protein [Clostridia bacterium]